MVDHNEDSCSLHLQIQENIDKRIVTDLCVGLAKISAGGRHIIHGIVRGVDHRLRTELKAQLTPGRSELEEMIKEKCTTGSDKRKT